MVCLLQCPFNCLLKEHCLVVNDLTSRVEELLDIRKSVLEELRQLEQNRSAVIKQISERNNEIDKLKAQISKRSTELERLQLHIKQAALAQKEAKGRVDALIEPPLDLLPKVAQQTIFINGKLSMPGTGFHYNCT